MILTKKKQRKFLRDSLLYDQKVTCDKIFLIDKINNIQTRLNKTDAIAKFNKFNCRDRIEAERTRDLIDLQSKGSIKAEESIVTKGFTEQKTYIIIGALVLLTGFYVIVKK